MIGFLRGKVIGNYGDYCLLDVGGVGYRVFTTAQALSGIALGAECSFFVQTTVREDAILLYGFAKREEYEAFQLLVSVSGIGPKGALAILSTMAVSDLYAAIAQENISALKKLPGVGKKSAERLVLELKDKVGGVGEIPTSGAVSVGAGVSDEATAALMALGYSQGEIARVTKQIAAATSTQEAIRLALKELGKG